MFSLSVIKNLKKVAHVPYWQDLGSLCKLHPLPPKHCIMHITFLNLFQALQILFTMP